MKIHRSVKHLAGREQKTLLAIKEKIVSLCDPVLIYYLGGNAATHTTRNCFSRPRYSEQWFYPLPQQNDKLYSYWNAAPH